jgi:hypothetical protein
MASGRQLPPTKKGVRRGRESRSSLTGGSTGGGVRPAARTGSPPT